MPWKHGGPSPVPILAQRVQCCIMSCAIPRAHFSECTWGPSPVAGMLTAKDRRMLWREFGCRVQVRGRRGAWKCLYATGPAYALPAAWSNAMWRIAINNSSALGNAIHGQGDMWAAFCGSPWMDSYQWPTESSPSYQWPTAPSPPPGYQWPTASSPSYQWPGITSAAPGTWEEPADGVPISVARGISDEPAKIESKLSTVDEAGETDELALDLSAERCSLALPQDWAAVD